MIDAVFSLSPWTKMNSRQFLHHKFWLPQWQGSWPDCRAILFYSSDKFLDRSHGSWWDMHYEMFRRGCILHIKDISRYFFSPINQNMPHCHEIEPFWKSQKCYSNTDKKYFSDFQLLSISTLKRTETLMLSMQKLQQTGTFHFCFSLMWNKNSF